ncbi:MAG: divergent polysaccharide deacetylase family protein [Pseudomonadota bacterium]
MSYEPPPPPDWRPIKQAQNVQPIIDQTELVRLPAEIDEEPVPAIVLTNEAEVALLPPEPTKVDIPEISPTVGDIPDQSRFVRLPKVSGLATTDQDIAIAVPAPDVWLPQIAPANRNVSTPEAPQPVETAYVTIIVDDLGLNSSITEKLGALPGPLTFSFLPYGHSLERQSTLATSRGHEVFVHLPMQPRGEQDPGPDAILAGMSDVEVREITRQAISRVKGAVGLNNHMGSLATADAALVRPMMDVLKQSGFFFIDSMTTPTSVAGSIARQSGVPSSRRDVFLDNDPSPTAIGLQLERLERQAHLSGTAIGIGHPYSTTLAALENWTNSLSGKGIELIPASKMIAYRLCNGDMLCDPRTSLVAQRNDVPQNGCALGYC